MAKNLKRPLKDLVDKPSAMIEAPTVEWSGSTRSLLYEIGHDDGSWQQQGIRFDKVRAFRWRAEGHCTPWHIEGAYDVLVEVEDSEWIAELRSAETPVAPSRWTIRHFMVYIDSAGCFEFAAESYSMLEERSASSSSAVQQEMR